MWRPRPLSSILLAAGLTACATAPPEMWRRNDGVPIERAKLDLDVTFCRGEVEKAAVQGQARSTMNSVMGPDTQDSAIYRGCMAGRGYLQAQ